MQGPESPETLTERDSVRTFVSTPPVPKPVGTSGPVCRVKGVGKAALSCAMDKAAFPKGQEAYCFFQYSSISSSVLPVVSGMCRHMIHR